MVKPAISICTGQGGLDLGIHLACPGMFEPFLYVEREVACARILETRMEQGLLRPAAIWSDVHTVCDAECLSFICTALGGRRLGAVWGGIPCQGNSLAGKRELENDPRNLWPATRRILRELEPEYFILENVRGILVPDRERGLAAPIARILGELGNDGWDSEWITLPASATGASHQRDRVFVLAKRQERGRGVLRQPSGPDGQPDGHVGAVGQSTSGHAKRRGRPPDVAGTGPGNGAGAPERQRRGDASGHPDGDLGDTVRYGRQAGLGDAGSIGRQAARGTEDSELRSGAVGHAGGGRGRKRQPKRGADRGTAAGRNGAALGNADQPGRQGRSDEPGDGGQEQPAIERVGREVDRADSAISGDVGHADGAGAARLGSIARSVQEDAGGLRAGTGELGDRDGGIYLSPPGPGLGLDKVVEDVLELLDTDPDRGYSKFLAELAQWAAWQRILWERPEVAPATSQPRVHGMAHGPASGLGDGWASRSDQLRALGNGCHVLTGCVAVRILMNRIHDGK